MGFFSWHTNDTQEPVWNMYSGHATKTVYMIDNKGNSWREDSYEGYGDFGGKDYYELLAEMNGLDSDRQLGIDLNYNREGRPFISPNLVTDPSLAWKDEQPLDHEGQGYWG
jgi:hypothetical protein